MDKKTNHGLFVTFVVILLLLLFGYPFLLKAIQTKSYGEWVVTSTPCVPKSQKCEDGGSLLETKRCVPDPVTNLGCLDNNGELVYGTVQKEKFCTVPCVSYSWQPISEIKKPGYTDLIFQCKGKDLAGPIDCYRLDENGNYRNHEPGSKYFDRIPNALDKREPTSYWKVVNSLDLPKKIRYDEPMDINNFQLVNEEPSSSTFITTSNCKTSRKKSYKEGYFENLVGCVSKDKIIFPRHQNTKCDRFPKPGGQYPCRYVPEDTKAIVIYVDEDSPLVLRNIPTTHSGENPSMPFQNFSYNLSSSSDVSVLNTEIVAFSTMSNRSCTRDKTYENSVVYFALSRTSRGTYKIAVGYSVVAPGWLKYSSGKIYWSQAKSTPDGVGLTYDDAEEFDVETALDRITIKNGAGESLLVNDITTGVLFSLRDVRFETFDLVPSLDLNCVSNRVSVTES